MIYITISTSRRRTEMAIDNIKKVGGNLNVSEGGSFGQGSTPKTNINMTMNGSIFNMGGGPQAGGKEDDAAKFTDLTQQGNNANKDAEKADNSAKGTMAGCKQIAGQAVKTQQENTKMAPSLTANAQKAFNTFTKSTLEATKLNAENEKANTEITTLQAEKEALSADDGTGSGKDSAFSLSIPTAAPKAEGKGGLKSASTKNEAAPDEAATTAADDKQAKIAEIDSKVGSLTSNVKSNTNSLKSANASATGSRAQINNLFNQASKQTAKATAQAEAAEPKISTTQTVGTATTVAGGATTAVGTVMTCFTPTAAAGVVTVKVGVGVTGVGAATTGAAALANKDTAGMNASTAQVASSAKEINTMNQQTKTPAPAAK